jgi:hypothetical protein
VAAAVLGLEGAPLAGVLSGSAGRPPAAATFQPFVGQDFLLSDRLSGSQTQAVLRLLQVVPQSRGARPSSLPNPFLLMFGSPWNAAVAAQAYTVTLPDHKSMAMFITPVPTDPYRYEAPFN